MHCFSSASPVVTFEEARHLIELLSEKCTVAIRDLTGVPAGEDATSLKRKRDELDCPGSDGAATDHEWTVKKQERTMAEVAVDRERALIDVTVEREKIAIERERMVNFRERAMLDLELERARLELERDRLAFERDRFAFEREKAAAAHGRAV